MKSTYLVAAMILVAGIVTTTAQLDENGLPLWWDGGAQPAVDENGYITIYGISPSGHTVPNETIETDTGPWMHYSNQWDHCEISYEPFGPRMYYDNPVSMPSHTTVSSEQTWGP